MYPEQFEENKKEHVCAGEYHKMAVSTFRLLPNFKQKCKWCDSQLHFCYIEMKNSTNLC